MSNARARIITYTALLDTGETISWERENNLTDENSENGPGYILQSMKTGSGGGLVHQGVYYPLHRVKQITWTVRDA